MSKKTTTETEKLKKQLEVEQALDKIRKRTLRMAHSDELGILNELIHRQLLKLGVEHHTTNLVTDFNRKDKSANFWLASEDRTYLRKFHHLFFDHPVVQNLFRSRGFYSESYSRKEKNVYFRTAFRKTDLKFLPEKLKQGALEFPGMSRAVIRLKNSALVVQRWSDNPFETDDQAIIRKFGGVFEQVYTRFLDLQKAEAHAREAQIETALEKVRSASMAMHNSNELQGVVNTVIDQLEDLEIKIDTTNILIFNRENIEYWTSSNSTGTQIKKGWVVPYAKYRYFKKLKTAYKKGDEIFHETFLKEEKDKMFTWLFKNTNFGNLPAKRKEFIF